MDEMMKKQNKILALTLATILLSSCGTVGGLKRDNREKKLKGSCDSAYGQTLVGKPFKSLKSHERPVNYRLIKPNSFVTQDHNPSRLNIYLDDYGTIKKVSCG